MCWNVLSSNHSRWDPACVIFIWNELPKQCHQYQASWLPFVRSRGYTFRTRTHNIQQNVCVSFFSCTIYFLEILSVHLCSHQLWVFFVLMIHNQCLGAWVATYSQMTFGCEDVWVMIQERSPWRHCSTGKTGYWTLKPEMLDVVLFHIISLTHSYTYQTHQSLWKLSIPLVWAYQDRPDQVQQML